MFQLGLLLANQQDFPVANLRANLAANQQESLQAIQLYNQLANQRDCPLGNLLGNLQVNPQLSHQVFLPINQVGNQAPSLLVNPHLFQRPVYQQDSQQASRQVGHLTNRVVNQADFHQICLPDNRQ